MPAKPHKYLCIHGHFYQPPRENPLTGQVELQDSAHPYHDWNERIFEQCYAPNGASRILDGNGRIKDVVNNYAFMSFNIGPTLFSWLEEKHPTTYARILEGDRLSCERLGGHGNALAQVYNHAIMPLAAAEEKTLQVKWGIADFLRRFGRRPEGIWLAETAINMDTVCCLIREGIRFTVLSPTQALKVRDLAGEAWTDVSNSTINPRRPYRIFPVAEDGTPLEKGYLDVFFYDGPLSRAVGFEHLLRSADLYLDRIARAFDLDSGGDQLVSVCTDGESYGHHEPFGDMCAAYLFSEHCPRVGIEPVNYAWYLAHHPPRHEVRLKNAYGEGTAWSCAHGVGRWKADCGCSDGGGFGWDQRWRGPLRDSLRILAEGCKAVLDRKGPGLFRDFEAAKADASLAWDLQEKNREDFFARHLREGAHRLEAERLVQLLRMSHYTFTSCGWFFSELTGLEGTQNLKYALQALNLLALLGEETAPLRQAFLARLAEARSNLGGKRGDLYFLELEAGLLPLSFHLVFEAWLQSKGAEEGPSVPGFRCLEKTITPLTGPFEGHSWVFGVFEEPQSGERLEGLLVVQEDGLSGARFFFRPGGLREGETREALLGTLPLARSPAPGAPSSPVSAPVSLDLPPGFLFLPPSDLPPDFRKCLGSFLKRSYWRESAPEIEAQERRILEKQVQFERLGRPLPLSLQQGLIQICNYRFVDRLRQGLEADRMEPVREALSLALTLKQLQVTPRLGPAKRPLHRYVLRLGRDLLSPQPRTALGDLFTFLDLLDCLGLGPERYRIENLVLPLFKDLKAWMRQGRMESGRDPQTLVLLLDRLNFNVEAAKTYLEEREK